MFAYQFKTGNSKLCKPLVVLQSSQQWQKCSATQHKYIYSRKQVNSQNMSMNPNEIRC